MNRLAIILAFLAPSAYAFDCKQVDIAELQLMTQEELVTGFCLGVVYKEMNSSLMDVRAMRQEAVRDWENCVSVTRRYNLVHREKYGSELSDQLCEDKRAQKSSAEEESSSARAQMNKQQRLDELKTLSLTYEEYQRRYKEIMALPN